MDNLTHTLCGLALARLGLDRFGRRATVTLAVGANLPDVDVVTLAFGLDVYLAQHRGVTHSLLGVLGLSLALAWVAHGVRRRRVAGTAPGPSFAALLACALLGVGSHLALDALNVYGVRPFLPFDGRWFYGDAVFVVDPWLWLLLGAAATLGAPRTLGSDVGWALVAAGAASVVVGSGRAPPLLATVWCVGMGVVLAGRFGWLPRPRRRVAAASFVAGALLYIGAAFVAAATARARALAAVAALLPRDATIDASSLTPLPALPWRHQCLVVQGGKVHPVRVDLLTGEVDVGSPIAQRLDDPVLVRVRMTQQLRAWRSFARVPYVATSRPQEVVLGDLRWGHEPTTHDWSSLRLPLD